MGRFFIDTIPKDAEWCDRDDFIKWCSPHWEDVYFLDPRWSLADVSNHKSIASHYFEIKDMQESQNRREVLCSVCIFKMHDDFAKPVKPFALYLDGLKKLIHTVRTKHADQKLRVYVGDSAWDDLQKEGIFKSSDVDFVRMKMSSSRTGIGEFWRFLAFDDYDYPIVQIAETDVHHSDRIWPLSLLHEWAVFTGASDMFFNFKASLLVDTPLDGSLLSHIYTGFYDTDEYQLYPFSLYIRAVTSHLIRFAHKLPFSMVDVLSMYLDRKSHIFAYQSSSNISIRLQEKTYSLKYMDDQWLFYLTKILNVFFVVCPWRVSKIREGHSKFGDNWFLKRLLDDLAADNNPIEPEVCRGTYVFND